MQKNAILFKKVNQQLKKYGDFENLEYKIIKYLNNNISEPLTLEHLQ